MKISLIASASTAHKVLSADAENARDYGYRDIELVVVEDRGNDKGLNSICDSISKNAIPAGGLRSQISETY